jgi:hypothetical protein
VSSGSEKKLHLPEFLLIALPIIVAVLQVRLVDTSNLTRWKGGGFGMYAEPHPASARNIWLTDGADAGVCIRLFPLDGRLERAAMQDVGLCRALEALADLARDHRNFPALKRTAPLRSALSHFYEDYGTLPSITGIMPHGDCRLQATELWLSADYHQIESRLIGDRSLCVP